MLRPLARVPQLDFVVIGAQKAGTTSLWRYLEDNPRIAMPPGKEATFFTEPQWQTGRAAYLRALFKDAPRKAKRGTVTPVYMLGTPDVPVATVAERIAESAPDVRLIALLRDPVDRALSAHRMAIDQGEEVRPFDEAVAAQLDSEALARARLGCRPRDSYVVAGEYGRMLSAYLEHFRRDQLHVELTDDLERDPVAVVARVCEFIGVEPHVPARAGERFYPGGPRRVSAEAEGDLKAYLARHVWPRMRHASQHREAFEFWFRLWNALPASPERPVDAQTRDRLREHYAADAARLAEATGVRPPWAT